MPLSDEGWQDITLGEGMTPVIRFSENVLRKMDYRILEARAELAAKGVYCEHTTAAAWMRLRVKGELRPNPLHAPLRA
uniref:hypothetical protein n=1 Tax=Enterocloster clostridioformis TaxID=1531 RepID=UPI003328DAC9